MIQGLARIRFVQVALWLARKSCLNNLIVLQLPLTPSPPRGETELLLLCLYTVLVTKWEGVGTLTIVILLLSIFKQIAVSNNRNPGASALALTQPHREQAGCKSQHSRRSRGRMEFNIIRTCGRIHLLSLQEATEIKISDLWQIQAIFQRWNTPTGAKSHSWHLPFKAGKPLSVICFLENFSGWHVTKYPHSLGLIFFTFAADKGKAPHKLTQEKRIFSTWIATYLSLCIIKSGSPQSVCLSTQNLGLSSLLLHRDFEKSHRPKTFKLVKNLIIWMAGFLWIPFHPCIFEDQGFTHSASAPPLKDKGSVPWSEGRLGKINAPWLIACLVT